MKVEIKLQPELKLPFAVIHTGEVTAEVQRAAAMLSEERAALISAGEDDKMCAPSGGYLSGACGGRKNGYSRRQKAVPKQQTAL